MEYSSPLAAMRPQPCPAWGNRRDLPMPRPKYNGCQTYGPNSFDFKSMSMQHQQQPPPKRDYFSLRPVRGSSPTSSLTADLDANFHIDQSPKVQTPRRALFTKDTFKPVDDAVQIITPPIETEAVTTPLVLSSSPGVDGMEISPLPHKPPFFVAQVTLPSPSPQETPGNEALVSPDLLAPLELPSLPSNHISTPAMQSALPERKRPSSRPLFTRQKAFSTNQIPQRPSTAQTQLPPFRFGNVAPSGLSCSSTPCLNQGIAASPVGIEPQQPFPSLGTMQTRRPSVGTASRTSGSPCGSVTRKPAPQRPAFTRPPRKQMRRSLSMFQHPEDVMKEEQETYDPPGADLSSIMDIDQKEQVLKVPHFIPDGEPDSLPRISQETMVDVLNSKYSNDFDNVMIVDCRFEYEYSGGHIENAVNYNDKHLLANKLFENELPPSTLLIFHCEYSVHRAPMTAKFIRSHDRMVNAASYPKLTYPDMYVLDGGYSQFFTSYRSKCFPQSYVEMNDERHEQACERGLARVKQQRQRLFRNNTFAFGQTDNENMQDSPTGQARAVLGQRSHSTFDVGPDISHGIGLSFQRRMASY